MKKDVQQNRLHKLAFKTLEKLEILIDEYHPVMSICDDRKFKDGGKKELGIVDTLNRIARQWSVVC
jgi:hypothetical protein